MKRKLLTKNWFWPNLKVLATTVFLFCLIGAMSAQNMAISGTVTDDKATPLPGVNVTINGTTTGTVTDLNGNYTIKVPGSSSVLSFTYVGYASNEIEVGDQTTINIILAEDVKQLNEVVVIGYGVQKRSDLTGAIASVKAEDITRVPSTGIAAALQGRAAGVQVSQESGAPGASSTIRIRGISSLNGGQPLWVIDGIPGGNFNLLNPNDIESIEILKDGASAAIYGANGGNGVILVTTKKGKEGKPTASVNYYHGYQYVSKRVDMATGPEYGATYTEMEALKGTTTAYRYPNFSTLPTYNYQDLVFKVAPMDNLDFSVTGGTDKINAYLGVGLINQEGIFKSSEFSKFSLRLNSEYKVTDWLKIGENFGFSNYTTYGLEQWQYENEYQSPLMQSLQVLPYMPPYDSVGNFVPKIYGQTGDPMVGVDLFTDKARKRFEQQGTLYAIIEPFKGMAIESRISGGLFNNNDYIFTPTYYFGPGPGENNSHSEIERSMRQQIDYNWQNRATYNTSLLNDFNVSAMVAYEVGGSENMDMSGKRRDLLSEDDEMKYFNASQDATIAGLTGSGGKSTGFSYLGRLNFDYKQKYLVQANFRRDYSSKFGPENRFGNFPGISAGWKFSEEGFVKNNFPFLSFGKLRYAWGNNGNNSIPDNAYYATVAVLQHWLYPFGNTPGESVGAAPNKLANQAIHWETIRNQNYGIDLNLFDNKLSITAEKFYRYNIGMLIPTTPPGYAGWVVRDNTQEAAGISPRPWDNLGKMTNDGWEFTIGWKDAIGKLKYSMDVTYTYVTSEATDLGEDSIRPGGGAMGFLGALTRTQTGGEIGSFYGYKVERMFTNDDPVRWVLKGAKYVPQITSQPYVLKVNATNPTKFDTTFAQSNAQAGDFKWTDINGDGKITVADQTFIGNPNPKHLFSLNMNFEYGWFDLSVFFEGRAGNKIFNAAKFSGVVSSGDYNWSKDYVDNHYRATEVVAKDVNGNIIATFPANTSAKYPRIDFNNRNAPNNYMTESDFYVEDGSYLRLKNIQLGITLPKSWTSKISISELKLYAGAKNVLTFTNYSGFDPEVPQSDVLASGVDKASYPQARSFIFGANIRF